MSKISEIIEMLASMTEAEKEALIATLNIKESSEPEKAPIPSKKKVRRKQYKKDENNSSSKINERAKPAKNIKFKPGPRENKFEKSSVFNQFKEDIELDKKLWKNREPTERDRKTTLYEVECTRCGKLNEVPGYRIHFMDNNEYSFVCDKCTQRMAR